MKNKTLIIAAATFFLLLTAPSTLFADNGSHINKLNALNKEINDLVKDLRETGKLIFDAEEKAHVSKICDEAGLAEAYFSDLSLMITLYDSITDKKKKEYAKQLIKVHTKFICGSSIDFAALINMSLSSVENQNAILLGNQIRTKIRETGDYICVMELK